jgi:DnaJ family protein A protein 2
MVVIAVVVVGVSLGTTRVRGEGLDEALFSVVVHVRRWDGGRRQQFSEGGFVDAVEPVGGWEIYLELYDEVSFVERIARVDALTGFRRSVQTLDDRELIITCEQVIKHGDVKMISNEGMPYPGNPFDKGNLVIKFQVNFPTADWFDSVDKAALRKLLPPPTIPSADMNDDAKECFIETFAPNTRRPERNAYNDDSDDDHPHGQRVQCANQ